MAEPRPRERIIELLNLMRLKTVANGCTPGEAEKFAAKVAEWMEQYQIEEAELRAAKGEKAAPDEVCQNILRTGKRAHNPGMTAVVAGLATGVCCRVVLDHKWSDDLSGMEAIYGVVGDQMDADYVCLIATRIVPALQIMANLEGKERGHEKAALVRWGNQYLTGAGEEIRRRLERERQERSEAKAAERRTADMMRGSTTGLALITGTSLAIDKRARAEEALNQLYPRLRKTVTRAKVDPEARRLGREAGRRVGIHQEIGGREIVSNLPE